ncbi:tRNA (adenosine(37)-N6)-dimethylallyltransferase MiaA, partial [Candidatus Saccharibacteria bacterium]|nr:tRNA (adenosine(37)-N6)-dimethylallyltransferase MiaA [Candidatus Saccharibacteria bacterium]
SRTVYKGMDIGTAKPTKAEQALVPHWGLDLVAPDERFTAADFKNYAEQKITEIRARGNIPFLVGGTGLYVDAVIFEYQFDGDINTTLRNKLEAMTIEDLQKHCVENNIDLPENSRNKRYLVRAIERKRVGNKRRETPIENCIVVGIATDRDILRERIARRSEQLFADGVVGEARILGKQYGWEHEAMTGNIYRIVRDVLDGTISLADAKIKFEVMDWRLAKRQLTWLRRNNFVQWMSLHEAKKYLQSVLTVL